MTPQEIKRARQSSLLKELLAEALASLNDSEISGVTVTEVVVKRGGYDADVYIDPSIYNEEEKREILKRLKKASGLLRSFCLESSGWYKCPKFHFKFDDNIERSKKIEDLFKKIKDGE